MKQVPKSASKNSLDDKAGAGNQDYRRPPMLEGYPEVLTVADVSEILRIAKSSAYEAVRRGDLPVLRVGGLLRFSREAIAELIRKSTA